jgi:hypothetical protein
MTEGELMRSTLERHLLMPPRKWKSMEIEDLEKELGKFGWTGSPEDDALNTTDELVKIMDANLKRRIETKR